VSVQVCYRNSMLELRVSDDGVGFDPTARPAGRGLINMRSRAARIGAELSVTPSSKGTVVLLRFNASAALREAA
jgi:signal transduction histidine kinase